jgi:hypothetical protein
LSSLLRLDAPRGACEAQDETEKRGLGTDVNPRARIIAHLAVEEMIRAPNAVVGVFK